MILDGVSGTPVRLIGLGGYFYTASMNQPKQTKNFDALTIELAGEANLYQIFPAGVSVGNDGRGPYILSNPDQVIERSYRSDVELVVDRDHAHDRAAPGTAIPAAGWMKAIHNKEGSLWAEIDWTPRAKQELADREYRYFSPVFAFDPQTREVIKILRGTLTNIPNLNMKAVASEGAEDTLLNQPQSNNEETTEMKEFKTALIAIASAIGLTESATPEDIQAKALERIGVATTLETEFASVRTSLKLDEKADSKLIIETASALVAAGDAKPDPSKFVPMEVHTAVASQLSELQKTTGTDKATAAVEAGMKAGKITPAMKAWAVEFASEDLSKFEKYLATAPVVVQASEQLANQPNIETGTDQIDAEICSQMGITLEDFKKARAS